MSDLVFTCSDSVTDPPAGTASIYAKADGLFYTRDSDGVETELKGEKGDTGSTGAVGPVGPSMWTIEGTFTITNNQSSAANVTGVLVNPTLYRGFVMEYSIYRNTTGTGATELSETGILIGSFKTVAGAWFLTVGPLTEESAGVTFSILATGQLQYVSTNMTGTADTSKLTYKVRALEK